MTGGGWSPDLFTDIIAAGFGLLTYRKNHQAGKDIPGLDDDAFAVMTWTGDDGRDRSYDLADGTIEVPVTSGTRKGERSTETSKPAPNNMASLLKLTNSLVGGWQCTVRSTSGLSSRAR